MTTGKKENQKNSPDLFLFLNALIQAEQEKKHEFTCPICGGQAHWSRSELNNHVRCGCECCGIKIVE